MLRQADSLFDATNWKASSAAYQAAIKADQTNGRAWYRLGAALQIQGSYKNAIDAYRKSIALKPAIIPVPYIQACLAKAYAQDKDSAASLALLSEMVTAGYINFSDLDSAAEYSWLRTSPRFRAIVIKATSNAYPCHDNPHNREFDFWVGKWDVFQTGAGFPVGKEVVETSMEGCLIIENWFALGSPNEGKSMNFVSTKTHKWEQVWMSTSGVYLHYYNGEYRDGAMRYEGDGVDKAGNKLLFHFTFFNKGPNEVRQLLEQSADLGKTWSTLYDFTYRRAN
jgi:tetratricopeptide (TPR) repeat protein